MVDSGGGFMTLNEARKVARIASTADGGCSACVGELFELLGEAFPEFVWETKRGEWKQGAEWDDDIPFMQGVAHSVEVREK